MSSDYLYVFPALLWAYLGIRFGAETYQDLRTRYPWQWFQGQVKARAVVLSVAFGACWPAVVILMELCRIPFVFRWVRAFLLWRHPRREP